MARTKVVAEPRWSPGGTWLGWLESIDGRSDLVVAPTDGSGPPVVVTAEHELGRVGAYRGGAWCWLDDDHLGVVTAAGAIANLGVEGGPGRLIGHDGQSAAPAAWSGGLLFASERDDALDVVELMWPAPDPERSGVGIPTGRRWSDADFAWDPAVTPDGRWVAWHEWDLAAMSWTSSRIMVADRGAGTSAVVAGGAGIAVGQPRFAPDGRHLAYVSDESGYWNVVVAHANGDAPRPLLAEPHDHAEPSWGPGQRSFAWSPDGDAIALCRNEAGFAQLVVVSLDGEVRQIAKGWHHGIDWGRQGIVAVRSGAKTPPQITVWTPTGDARRVVARGAPAGLELGAREPRPVTWTRDGMTVPGLLYPPDGADDEGAGAPPLLVDVHGGPTGQATVTWDGWLRYFTSRGWAVLRPNPRGSTGYGRSFAQGLQGTWGSADVEDVIAGIRAAGDQGWCDPDRVAIAGGSSGGLTALMVGAQAPDLVRAVVSAYGVTDLFDLAATTHRFESRYLDELVGVLPGDEARFREQSPVTHADRLRAPLLVLQGDADKVVPPRQAELLVDAVRAAGGVVEFHVYDGEGHGWSKIETVQDELERTQAFLEQWVLQP
ncbi:MAG: S9 family peptidase [Acidimicrobiia bacterium]|nr:S9 family peptidase [Acidimicrobiia bacterium]